SSSPAIAGGVKRPTRRLRTGRPNDVSLFGLAPCGVLPATRVATGAVRSYRPFSPLPASALAGFGAAGLATCRWLCIFCATVLQVALTGGYPAHCPAEFGLSSHLRALRRSGGRSSGSLQQSILPLSIRLLRDLVLFELLVQIAARRADHFGRLRDVPPVLAQLADQEIA